ncbi:MAG TPA: hypothetical protein VFW84_11585 [Aquabacterium sp.]|uniref:hypothetical protein n=1 Tax=Aquabacterium sp. TaxID=1872578 RepID=UPI002E370A84|nr:hypothetical protein [Aquabacterium sp.]HEX5373364.1 hypothetical protein [Aquabacterium sp.]
MAPNLEALALVGFLAACCMLAWVVSLRRKVQPLAHWTLLHIDHNGQLQRAAVAVLGVHHLERRLMVRRHDVPGLQTLKISRIVEAIDVPSGKRVNLERWLEHIAARQVDPDPLDCDIRRVSCSPGGG